MTPDATVPPADVPRTAPRPVEANGVQLCVQTFGDPADPAVLLIGGATSSMDGWDEEFCARIAAGGRYVVRYDQRDTGRSVTCPAGAPDYTFADLMADVTGLLDALEVGRAHLVGVSMGGGLAQCLAVARPERVASLTLVATSPAGPTEAELPPPAERVRAVFTDPAPDPDWSDRAAVIAYLVEGERLLGGAAPLDEEAARERAGRIVDRSTDIEAAMKNHWILPEAEDPVTVRLADVAAPTLVLHGTDDPFFPLGHGRALAEGIPGARLVVLDGAGHEPPPARVWDTAIPAILAHTDRT
ncbi:alpha/beta fold hydrolase [Streptomyces sp. NBC_01498]|uniref:alpha/beta fold hydrolase n=1 Tax=Streptomyces sp. NBC_01498 TaxID=2975870 RepID=UPI002E7C02BB|nr:alpha/beta hydrolase [Streptomyces sp. NBC_01498]WTL23238.1 alpha/beta fold hydrolase [Streptomyces sp. NBC_01498]